MLQHFQFCKDFLFIPGVLKYALYFMDVIFHFFQFFRQQNASFVQQPYMVTDIFQLTQIVRCDDRCKVPFHDFRCKNALHCLTYNRIQSVKTFVTYQIFCSGTDAKKKCHLPFHAFGKRGQLPCKFQSKSGDHFPEAFHIKLRIDHLIIFCHRFCRCILKEIGIVRKKENLRFRLWIFIDILPVDQCHAGIWLQNSADHTQKCALTGSICPDQPENAAFLNGCHNVVQCFDLTKHFVYTRYFNHVFPPCNTF